MFACKGRKTKVCVDDFSKVDVRLERTGLKKDFKVRAVFATNAITFF